MSSLESTLKKFARNIDPNKSGFQTPGFSWDEYIKYRPVYHDSFYERIYSYHAAHSFSFAVAHDTGAGAGIASQVLAQNFDHVHVSDPGPEYVQIAEKRLNSLRFSADKFTFHAEGAEKSSVESNSVDLLLIAEAIHWCDIPVAMKEFARQLRKGGTLAITIYGPPNLRNPKASKMWHEILQRYFKDMADTGGVYKRAMNNGKNGFQLVQFDTKYYAPGAQRIFINTGGNLGLLSEISQPLADEDQALETDEKSFIEDDPDWIQVADTELLRGALTNMLIGVDEEEVDKVWPAMEEALGGKEAKFELIWPNMMFLATKA